MRRFLLLTFITMNGIHMAAQDIDVLHYQYSIDVNDNNDTIVGNAVILVKFLRSSSSATFDLTLLQQNGKGMQVGKVTGANVKSLEKLGNRIRILLAAAKKQNDTASFTIPYRGIPSDGLIISKNKYGHRSFFADNWPNRGHNWIPCVDNPADKASVDFIVTAPRNYQVVANGVQVEETNLAGNRKLTHWKEEVPISTKVMVIGVADFAVQLSGVADGCIPVYSWVYPEDRDKGFHDYGQALEILPFFTRNVGPYGYKKLANVQSKTIFGGLENANTIFYSESSVTGTRKSESLLAHEIAHQWFGNMATEKTFAHLWLSEGFATYMTILYMENKYGADTAISMLNEDRDQVIQFSKRSDRSVVDTTSDYMQLLNANSYQKGGWILHMLRRQLGDSLFWKGIRTYYSTFAGKTADTDDLRKVFEDVSRKDLKQFFTQWLYTKGIPELKIRWKYVAASKTIDITVEQMQNHVVYQFPLEIVVSIPPSNAKPKVEKLNITKKIETFSIPVRAKPSGVKADPFMALLFTGTVSGQ